MIIILFLEGMQLAEFKNKFFGLNMFNKHLKQKRKILKNKGKITLIILQKLRNK